MATVYGVMCGMRPGVATRATAVAFGGRPSTDDDFADQPVRGRCEFDRAVRLLDVRR